MSINYLKELGTDLIDQGYSIVPIKKGYKHPKGLKAWESLEATHKDVRLWSNNGFKDGGVGVKCGYVVPLDIDITDVIISQMMVDWCLVNLGSAPQRIGQAPKTMFIFRTEQPFTKLQSKSYSDFFNEKHKVEVLGQGQQFVAYAEHPSTSKPYKWVGGPGISDIHFNDLPLITLEQAQAFIDYFEEIRPKEWQEVGRSSTNDFSHKSKNVVDIFDSVAPKVNLDNDEIKEVLDIISEYADDRDTWINIGKALHHQFDGSDEGLELFDEWSQNSAKYDDGRDGLPKDKWRGFYTIPKGKRPVTFAYALKLKKVVLASRSKQSQLDKIKQTRSTGVLDLSNDNNKLKDRGKNLSDLDLFLERYIFVEQGKQVCDLTRNAQCCLSKLDEFQAATANVRHEVPAPTKTEPDKTKVVPVHNSWLVHPKRQGAFAAGYHPDRERVYTDPRSHLTYINTFHVPNFTESEAFFGEIDVFLEHMNYLVPDKYEREWFIDWIAFNVQRPEPRCKVTPLHVSVAHGTGRGWVVELMQKLLGRWNCTKTKMENLCNVGSAGAFNEFLDKSLLCCIEEVKESSKRYEISDKIRSTLTELSLDVNIKYGGKGTKDVFTNFFLMSNHRDALVLTEEDRRIQVLSGPNKPQNSDYYDRLYTWAKAEENIASLYHWLLARDLSQFDWKYCTKTTGRARMIDSTCSLTEIAFKEFVRGAGKTAFSYHDVIEKVQALMEGDPFENTADSKQILKLLQQHCSQASRLRFDGKLIRPWLFGNWKEIDNGKVKECLEANKEV